MKRYIPVIAGITSIIGAVLFVIGLAGFDKLLIPGIILLAIGLASFFFSNVLNQSNESDNKE